MKLKCFLKGHRHWKDRWGVYEDVCQECGMHSYFDSYQFRKGSLYYSYDLTLPSLWHFIRVWFLIRKYRLFRKCIDCQKQSILFGKEVGDHENCLPF